MSDSQSNGTFYLSMDVQPQYDYLDTLLIDMIKTVRKAKRNYQQTMKEIESVPMELTEKCPELGDFLVRYKHALASDNPILELKLG